MNEPMGRMLYIYSSLFIAIALNIARLLALKEDSVMARYMHFDTGEWLFQTGASFLFCLLVFLLAAHNFQGPFRKWTWGREGRTVLLLLLLFFCFTAICIGIQRRVFGQGLLPGNGIGMKFMLILILAGIELKIVNILRMARFSELENVRLRNAHLKTELELLKGQLQPHFFFNALSSLSGVVREDPAKAQYYINQLSRVFRYSLQREDDHLVSLKEELDAVRAYAALLKMRHEAGFELIIDIPDTLLTDKLPHMSLQPLMENALKHNVVTVGSPLLVIITAEKNGNSTCLLVRNNLQPLSFYPPGTGIGLSNLNERYRILLEKEISINKTAADFIVKLPLK
ncbi:signal transduction histidine kinase, LytS [Chitinophaga pinensis DSM 2588]|uniref:Signal transduction histidine kinase, LytS n=2 Tax=Chitinophaga pinensis TaxID=79329 RepID=A0A979GYK1_CHIPD|nr:signal transduction histidine kinase, LytS [Chitinophaga pinensis DSM 2588]